MGSNPGGGGRVGNVPIRLSQRLRRLFFSPYLAFECIAGTRVSPHVKDPHGPPLNNKSPDSGLSYRTESPKHDRGCRHFMPSGLCQ